MSSCFVKRPLAAGVASILLMSACVTNPDGSYALDNRALGALIGAGVGCATGAALQHGGKGCAVGAAAGAVAGFLIGWYFESKKLADARVVNAEYERQGKAVSVPKNDVVPAKFESRVNTVQTSTGGEREVQVTSNTDLIGYGDKVPEVQQKYAIYDESNNLVEEKTEKIAAVDGAGRYQTSSKFKLPADAKDKNYTVKTTLVSNNKAYKENTYKLTLSGQQLMLAAL